MIGREAHHSSSSYGLWCVFPATRKSKGKILQNPTALIVHDPSYMFLNPAEIGGTEWRCSLIERESEWSHDVWVACRRHCYRLEFNASAVTNHLVHLGYSVGQTWKNSEHWPNTLKYIWFIFFSWLGFFGEMTKDTQHSVLLCSKIVCDVSKIALEYESIAIIQTLAHVHHPLHFLGFSPTSAN